MDSLKNEFSSMKPLSYYLDDAVFLDAFWSSSIHG
jgi:hypothetical protein